MDACRIRWTRGRPRRERPPGTAWALRIVSRSGYGRTVSDRRRHGNDVAGAQRRPQSDVQSPGYVTILHRGVPGSPPHSDRRASTATSGNGSAIPSAAGRPTRSSSIPSTFSTGRTTNGPASGRGLPRRCISSSGSRGSTQKRSSTKITVEDPATFSSPWTAVIPISRLADDTRIYEYACHEGNYAMPNLLSAGRAVAAKQQSSN